MIAHVKGTLTVKTVNSVVVDVGGVGYEVFIPVSTYYSRPEPGQPIELKTLTFVRDDAIEIYGFFTMRERELFQMLITVSGIGPKLARNILSGRPPEELVGAIRGGEVETLKSLPGVGKKTAERLVLELREKVDTLAEWAGTEAATTGGDAAVHDDLVSALRNLGYRPQSAKEAARTAAAELNGEGAGDGASFDELLKAALRNLS